MRMSFCPPRPRRTLRHAGARHQFEWRTPAPRCRRGPLADHDDRQGRPFRVHRRNSASAQGRRRARTVSTTRRRPLRRRDTSTEAYAFAGTKTEKIEHIGNAVSVSKMKGAGCHHGRCCTEGPRPVAELRRQQNESYRPSHIKRTATPRQPFSPRVPGRRGQVCRPCWRRLQTQGAPPKRCCHQ